MSAPISAQISMSTANWIAIAVCLLAVVIIHIPIRGSSLRDRIRAKPTTIAIGFRLLPGMAEELSAREITALIDEAPFPVHSLSFHRVQMSSTHELAHQYFAIAQRLQVPTDSWTHLIIETDLTKAQVADTADFIRTRLGHCGLRTRPLLPAEIALSTNSRPIVRIQQAGRNVHEKRNYLWMSKARNLHINPSPQQVLGVGSDGRALTIRLADTGLISIDTRAPDALILPALALGYRVGIRTGSPQHFRTALAHGAVLVSAAADEHLDVIFFDTGTSVSADGFGGAFAWSPSTMGPAIVVSEPNPLSTLTDLRLTIGQLTWQLHAGAQHTQARPIPLH